jgi:sigma-E factor negative regulatory protein RseA
MSDPTNARDVVAQSLSALVDGEAAGHEVNAACQAWRESPEARGAWHRYQLIGDVMRSEDLAAGSSSAAFLARFKERLATEPVVLAPDSAARQRVRAEPVDVPVSAPSLRRRMWAGPMAVAAGFVMVVGALISTQGGLPGGAGPEGGASRMAAASSGGGFTPQVDGVGMSLAAFAPDAQGDGSFEQSRNTALSMMRDPRLDQTLAGFRHNSAPEPTFAGQGGDLREVGFDLR